MSKTDFQRTTPTRPCLLKSLSLFTLALLALVGSAHGQFKFKSFDFPGAFLTTARGINDHGVIVGAYDLPFQPRHALLIKNGEYIPILPKSILGIRYSEATNINNRGDITGQMLDENQFGHGFLVKNGELTILNVPGASDTFALGINDSGLVAGYWDLLDANFNTLALYGFTWKDGVFIDTQINFPGAAGSALFGLNARGDLSGVWVPDFFSGIEHGFVCPKSAPCFSYDAPAEVPGTVPFTDGKEINAHGQVVGIEIGGDGIWHSYLMSGATFTKIDVPGSTGTGAFGINSAGQIVGKYFTADENTHGFLAEPAQIGKSQ
jgi:probable HAF family extracellular repeat protein